MIAIRVCPICKKTFEGRVGVPKVYCDDCMITQDLAAMDEAVKESSWFFDGDDEKFEEIEDEKDPILVPSLLPSPPRQSKESLLSLIQKKRS